MSDAGPPVEGRDYVVDERGRLVFTRAYLLGRGQCCGSGCRNCPYGNAPSDRIEKPRGSD